MLKQSFKYTSFITLLNAWHINPKLTKAIIYFPSSKNKDLHIYINDPEEKKFFFASAMM